MATEQLLVTFPSNGIKLSYFFEFVEKCGGNNCLQGLTTSEVCDLFIKPLTNAHQTSYLFS
jgi:hypothetical protein